MDVDSDEEIEEKLLQIKTNLRTNLLDRSRLYKCPCYGNLACHCKRDSYATYIHNINDFAETLARIMTICGIHRCRATGSICIILKLFINYDAVVHCISPLPCNHINRKQLMDVLVKRAMMTTVEAKLAYYIIKRAMKAFFYGTNSGKLRNPILDLEMMGTQKSWWIHAAAKTAQKATEFQDLQFDIKPNFDKKIINEYKELYNRFRLRMCKTRVCPCDGCTNHSIPTRYCCSQKPVVPPPRRKSMILDKFDSTYTDDPDLTNCILLPKPCKIKCEEKCNRFDPNPHDILCHKRRLNHKISNTSLNLPRCYKCNCPAVICDCNVDRTTGVLDEKCGQGPFQCTWIRVHEKQPIDICIERPENHHCPVDCNETNFAMCCIRREQDKCYADQNEEEEEMTSDDENVSEEDIEIDDFDFLSNFDDEEGEEEEEDRSSKVSSRFARQNSSLLACRNCGIIKKKKEPVEPIKPKPKPKPKKIKTKYRMCPIILQKKILVPVTRFVRRKPEKPGICNNIDVLHTPHPKYPWNYNTNCNKGRKNQMKRN